MKTASKAVRVPADTDESSPTPVRVLRNGKKIRATPRLPKASRVTLSPEDTMALGAAHRVPFTQVPPSASPANLDGVNLSLSTACTHLTQQSYPRMCPRIAICLMHATASWVIVIHEAQVVLYQAALAAILG